MASSSSEYSEDDSNQSDKFTQRIMPVPWTVKENSNSNPGSFGNSFKNDGSFLEMFKKMQEQNSTSVNDNSKSSRTDNKDSGSSTKHGADDVGSKSSVGKDTKEGADSSSNEAINKSVNRFVGKRRPARVLPTGLVKKQRKDGTTPTIKGPDSEPKKNDPWSKYMDEVRKYKQQSCSEEESTRRPLVK